MMTRTVPGRRVCGRVLALPLAADLSAVWHAARYLAIEAGSLIAPGSRSRFHRVPPNRCSI